ncbi:threonine/serine dehydratase [Litorilinea aerophila]|uniref:threonine ammonia-lyase n=1 Tax=Litorilinea aerophila TaxID=1204385 RepID=A0A540VAI7_9CHLR|nr:threonine/serine dehydratase [Litorilinea aerophila]MCC9078388.1 threonine/serine dehydratase [Litorilinea aerophila]OUC06199.1 threonine ammonia-lyase [Litorilinea aerophila]
MQPSSPPLPSPPTFQDILRARQVIRRYLPPTPLHRYPSLDRLLGASVYVKHENYQPIGAFKIRGGINFMAHLDEASRQRGVVTASTGNHGQSIAYAAQLFGIRAVIVVPEGANPVKVEAMRSYGAEVVFHGADFEASKRHCATLEAEEGLRFISSGDEPLLIAGVGTHALEMLEAQPDLEVILVPVGGGSGAAGAALVAKAVDPNIRVIGVQARGAPAAYLTWKERTWRTAPIETFAGGLATGEPFMLPQQILWQHLDDFVLVDDQELLVAIRLYLEKAKTLAEPAGAAPLAAALRLREQLQGRRVGLILSGGNISPDELRQALDGS